MQTKKQSLIESLTNTGVGFIISVVATYFILPLFGLGQPSYSTSVAITLVYTVISIIRNYLVRRFFNYVNYLPKKE